MSEALKRRSEEIRNETGRGANTSERVGGVLVDIVAELDDLSARLEGDDGLKGMVDDLTVKVDEIGKKLDEFMGFTYINSIEIPTHGGGVLVGVKTTNKEWEVQ